MNEKKNYPLDIDSIIEYGIKDWSMNFFWPLSKLQTIEMELKIKEVLNKEIRENQNNIIKNLLLINYKIYLTYLKFLSTLYLFNKLKENKLIPLYTSNSTYNKSIFEHDVPSKYNVIFPTISPPNLLKDSIRSMKVLLSSNNISTAFNLFKKPVYILNQSFGSLTLEFLKKEYNSRILSYDIKDFYWNGSLAHITKDEEKIIELGCHNLIRKIEGVAKHFKVELNEKQSTFLEELTHKLFFDSYIIFKNVSKSISKQKDLNLFIGGNNNVYSRSISLAILLNGDNVASFHHGHPLVHETDFVSTIDLPLVTHFFHYKKTSSEVLKKNLQNHPTPNFNIPEFEGAETKYFYDIWKKESSKPYNKEVKKIVIMGDAFPREPVIYSYYLSSFQILFYEYNLINLLNKEGFEVLYQKHPDGYLKNRKITFYQNIEISYDTFEKNLDRADALIFFHTRSSTFGPALCTNKRIILVDTGLEFVHPEMHELLSKRIEIVRGYYDECNRFTVDKDELLNALNKKVEEPNLEFVQKFLI